MKPLGNVLVEKAGGRGGQSCDRGPPRNGFRALSESWLRRRVDDIDVSLQAAVNAIVAEIERSDFLRFDGFKLKPLVRIRREGVPFAAREKRQGDQYEEQDHNARRRLQQ